MRFIFFVPPNEELEGTLHPQKFWCTTKNEGKGYMYPQMKKPVGMLEQAIKKRVQIPFHLKRPHTATKMNDNINMEKTIVNASC